MTAKKKDGAAAGGGGREGRARLQGAPDGSAYDFVAGARGLGGGKIPRGSILTPADGSPAFRVDRSNGFVVSGFVLGGKGKRAGIDLRQTDAGLDLSGSF